jgi:3-deoxy-D-manno-octulosonic acid kinase
LALIARPGVEAWVSPFAVPTVRAMLDAHGTLYAAAAATPGRREYTGRAPAYGIALGDTRVVVRHSRHGGLLAPLTGDLFLPPTRAAREREVATRLAEAGVPTPEVLAYAIYRAGPLVRRADVVTREIEGARDLAAHPATLDAKAAVQALLRALERATAVHPDLNAKNILLADREGVLTAYVIDVDRVVFRSSARGVDQANRSRLRRSIAKLGLGYTV